MNRTACFIFLFCFSGGILLAQEKEHLADSAAMRFMPYPSPLVASGIPLMVPDSKESLFPGFRKENDFPKSWNEFKAAFLALPLPEEFAMMERLYKNMELGKKYPPSLWLNEEEIIRNNARYQRPIPGGAVVASTSIIQELYDLYSHEGKMKRKYDSLVRQDNIRIQATKKYDIALVKRITGFDDTTAQKFMDFCDFKSDSILQANHYDVYNMIYDCLSQFIKEE